MTCLPYLIDPQLIGEREADIKRLQEQLTEANQAIEANQATHANQSQSSQSIQASDANAAGEANQALQEELAKLRQEVPKVLIVLILMICWVDLDFPINIHTFLLISSTYLLWFGYIEDSL